MRPRGHVWRGLRANLLAVVGEAPRRRSLPSGIGLRGGHRRALSGERRCGAADLPRGLCVSCMQHRVAIELAAEPSSFRRASLIRRRATLAVVRAAAFEASSEPCGDDVGSAGAARFVAVDRSADGGGGPGCDRSRRRSPPGRSSGRTGVRWDHGRTALAATRAGSGTSDRVEGRPRIGCAPGARRALSEAPREAVSATAGSAPWTEGSSWGLALQGVAWSVASPRREGRPRGFAPRPAREDRLLRRPGVQGEKAAASETGGGAMEGSALSRSSASWTS